MEPRRRNPLRRYPTAVCISVWHFELTQSKTRALNSPGFKVYFSGRGAAKPYSFALALVAQAYEEKHLILCTRQFQNSIADSVHRSIVWAIEELGLRPWFLIEKQAITCT